jgi:hypothetical protein
VAGKPENPVEKSDPSYVLSNRDYADIVHLENPNVIERILSSTKADATAYVCKLLQSGVPRFISAGPKVAFSAMVIEALTDLGKEVSDWIRMDRIPEDFSGRPSGYQTWVDLLQEIDSNPIDGERLKAMKAMFLAANRLNASDGESVAAYQLFQIAKRMSSGQLLLLRTAHARATQVGFVPDSRGAASIWLETVAQRLGHGISGLVELDERLLIQNGLLTGRTMVDESAINDNGGRLTPLALKFCESLQAYDNDLKSSRE